jgi:hypothetical protein
VTFVRTASCRPVLSSSASTLPVRLAKIHTVVFLATLHSIITPEDHNMKVLFIFHVVEEDYFSCYCKYSIPQALNYHVYLNLCYNSICADCCDCAV